MLTHVDLVVVAPSDQRYHKWLGKRGVSLQQRPHHSVVNSRWCSLDRRLEELAKHRGYELKYLGGNNDWLPPEAREQLERYSYPTDLGWALSRREKDHDVD